MIQKAKVFLVLVSLTVAMLALIGCTEGDRKTIDQTLDELAAEARAIRLQREAEEREQAAQQRERQEQQAAQQREVQRQYELEIGALAKKVSYAIKPTHPTVRTYAVQLARQFPGPYKTDQVGAIWRHVKHNWRYVNDPRSSEYFAPGNETIEAGLAGDCDDFAILLASLIEAIGGSARIVLASGPTGSHAFCELYMGNREGPPLTTGPYHRCYGEYYDTRQSKSFIVHWHKGPEEENNWCNLDWSADYPGGPFIEATREIFIYPDGTWE